MNKEQQIEEIKRVLISVYGRIRTGGEDFLNNRQAEALYNAGYRKVPYGAVDEITRYNSVEAELQELNIKYYNEAKDLRRKLAEAEKQIAELEKENKRLERAINNIQKGFDNGEFISKDCKINALKQFAEKIKNEVYPFLQAEMHDKKHFITGDSEIDKRLENQNIGIIKAQDVLSKWFKVKIDELLKEYEK